LGTFFWGLSFPVVKAMVLTQARILPESSTWFLTAYAVAPRFAIGAFVMLLWQSYRRVGVTTREWSQGLGLGLFSAAGMLLQNDGLQFTAASTSAFLTQFTAILIPLYLAVRLRRIPSLTVWISCFLVLAGVAILGRFDWRQLRLGRGECETLLAAVFFVGQILWLDRKEFALNRSGPITLVMFSVQAVIFGVLAFASAPHPAALLVPWHSLPWVGFTLALAVFCTLGSYGLMNAWQPKITPTEAGLIYCFEPIFGSLMALVLPGFFSLWAGIAYDNEKATRDLLIGGGLITAANVLIQLRPPPKA
jgi:drug/metabolite transporter (DMT)-like permease